MKDRLLGYLLNVIYLSAIAVGLPWFIWCALTKGKYRQGFAQKWLGQVPKRASTAPCIWLHAVSVGEVNLLSPLLDRIKQRTPGVEIVISSTTATGYALASRKYADCHVIYCPLDFSWAVRRALSRIQPDLLVLAELELWPNLIRIARHTGARVAIVNGRLSDRSFRGYRCLRFFIRRLLAHVDLIAAQDAATADRFADIGAQAKSVVVIGSMKFDGAQTCRENRLTQNLKELAGIESSDVVFLAGSTQHPEEDLALATHLQLSHDFPQLRLIVVPRHPERFDEVAQQLNESGVAWQRRSRLADSSSTEAEQPRILLVDTVGELGGWWGLANIGFVGGSLGSRGGQNMIEPAAYGVATCFGPNTKNFRDIVAALLRSDAAQVVQDGQELTDFVRRCLQNAQWAEDLGSRAQQLVRSQTGATDRTMELLLVLLPSAVDAQNANTRAA